MTNRRDDILDYLDGQLDDAQQAELCDWLNQSPEHWEQFARLSFLHGALGTQLRNEQSVTAFRIDSLQAVRDLPPDPEPAFKTVGHAVAYIVQETVTPKRLLTAAAAAVFLLAATLFILFQGDSTPANNPAAPTTAQTPGPAPVQTSPVATLSATHNARWSGLASLAPSVGDALAANQRFTLTQGFAEITTARGAIAIIEAPATIQLTDNDNSLRLVFGKLVGICETPTSKGFVVRTPHMDITDLGTRFGVDATNPDTTEVHVYQGEVEVAKPSAVVGEPANLQRLTEGQALRSDPQTRQLVRIDASFHAFSVGLGFTRLFSTGYRIEEGQVDPDWQVIADGKGPLDPPIPMLVKFGPDKIGTFPALGNDPAVAQHLVFNTSQVKYNEPVREGLDDTSYTVRHHFMIDEQTRLDGTTLYLKYTSSRLGELRINGQLVQPLTTPDKRGEFEGTFHEAHLSVDTIALRPGENVVEIELRRPEVRTQVPPSVYFVAELRPLLPETGEFQQ